jgi:hypothetical protein
MSTAIQALNLGAYRYVIKTDTLVEELTLTVDRALEELALREENDAGSAIDGFWKRIDPWGFAFFHKAKEITKKPLRLTFSLRSPDTPQAESQYEALKRRVSYLAEANRLQIILLKGNADDKLYSFKELTDRPDWETIRSDFKRRRDDDTPGRLEKDFQTWLFGKGFIIHPIRIFGGQMSDSLFSAPTLFESVKSNLGRIRVDIKSSESFRPAYLRRKSREATDYYPPNSWIWSH